MKLFFGEINNQTVIINDEEQQHIVKVLRMKEGEEIHVTDGKGNLASGTLVIEGKKAGISVSEIKTETRDFSRMEAHISNTLSSIHQKYERKIPDRLGGQIDISVINRSQSPLITTEINRLNTELTSKDYKLGQYLGNVKIDPLPRLTPNVRIDSYVLDGLTEKLSGYEYWIAVLQTNDHFILVQLATLGRNENFTVWAENTETYKALIQSLNTSSQPEIK